MNPSKKVGLALVVIAATCTQASVWAKDVSPKAVMQTYTDIAHAVFSDSLSTAKVLKNKVDAFIAEPSQASHQAAKEAWLAARIPYGQSEVFRFANPNVDEWEGQVNAWPLDEGLIDYVDANYEHDDGNQFASANIIASKDTIDSKLLASLHEKGGAEANVATGYHAIEFLLWGQDLNQSPKDKGLRSYTDYSKGKQCTHGNCERRAQYLAVVSDVLVKDLETMVDDWADGKDNYRKTFMALPETEALRRMLFAMGSLSLGELAGERIHVALLAHAQEDEHSCFSDNTHHDIAENARGIQNIFNGSYTSIDGKKVAGASLAALVAAKDKALSEQLITKLTDSQSKAEAVVKAAEAGEHFDQQILSDNAAGNERVKAVIDALRAQTADIEAVSKVLGIDNINANAQDASQG